MPVQLTSKIPGEIQFNDSVVRLLFARMSIDQFATYSAEWSAWSDKRAAAGGPADVLLRSRAPKTDAERQELDEHMSWLRRTFTDYVSVVPGDLTLDGTDVETGKDLFELIANYLNLVPTVLSELYYAQRLTEDQKKALRSLRDFGNSAVRSIAGAPVAATAIDATTTDSSGAASGAIAASAAPEASTASAAASLGQVDDLSGPAAASSSTDAQSDSSASSPSAC